MEAGNENKQTWLQVVTESLKGLSLSERQLRNRRRGRYIFTDKKHPWRGILSTLLGVFSAAFLVLSLIFTLMSKAEAEGNYSIGLVWGFIFSLAGLITGILSSREKDIYIFFPRTGIILNAASFVCFCFVLYLGLRSV